MEEEILQDAGLTKGESRVYLALLKIGENTVGPLAKEANISLSKIYEVLENLIKKGLVGSVMKNNVRHFFASSPERIIDYMESRKKEISKSEEKIKSILPSLKSIKSKGSGRIAILYEGFKGIKTFYESILDILDRKDAMYALGIPRYAAEKYEIYFLNWNKRRAKKEISIKVIYNYDVKDFGKKRAKLKYTEVRYLSENFVTPAWILIFKDTVATIHLTSEPICVVIKDKNVADSYMNFFNILWKKAKK